MEAILLVGLQASGKSTFYCQRLFTSHVRISLDLLKTRHREQRMLSLCLDTRQPFAVDNTNPTRQCRAKYIDAARRAEFRVAGYYFQSRLEDCKQRNADRQPSIPPVGLLATLAKLQLPSLSEGFDELYYVSMIEDGFQIEEWRDEI